MKRNTLIITLVILITLSLIGCEKNYKIGDFGPAGGIIFFDKGNKDDGWRYLEAAPFNHDFITEWGASGMYVPGTQTGIGTGKRNTEIIVTAINQAGETGRAAQMCVALNIKGYKDWFLPSKDELNLMYNNLQSHHGSVLAQDGYWTSSQGNTNNPWYQVFQSGSQFEDGYAIALWVRAVRAF